MPTGASQQEIFEAIFGSGFDTYPWWVDMKLVMGNNEDDYFEPDDGWVMMVQVEDDDDERGYRVKPVSARSIRQACQNIMSDTEIGRRLRRECSHLLFNVDELDIDADAADVIMQYVVFDGEIIYN